MNNFIMTTFAFEFKMQPNFFMTSGAFEFKMQPIFFYYELCDFHFY